MSKMTNLNVKVDAELKKECEEIFAALGITTSAAVNMFLKQCVRSCGIPFELKADIPAKKPDKALCDR